MSIGVSDVRAAAQRLQGVAVRTPVMESAALGERLGGRLFVKTESLQRGGAFKIRGAYNRLARLPAAERTAGVVAFSSGNHAQGVALAARLLDIAALIVMPKDAPKVKLERTAALGAEIRTYDRMQEDREQIATAIAAERGAVLVPSFDDPDIIAGQGTVGLEIIEQAAEAGFTPDIVIGPVGGGGLMAGVSLAVKALASDCRIFGVEPATFDDTRRSLEAGRRTTSPPAGRSLCDALESPMPGELTFPILRSALCRVETVSDAEVAAAMRTAFSDLRLVVEPGGAAALAAVLAGKVRLEGASAVVILSGGNVDPDLFADIITGRD